MTSAVLTGSPSFFAADPHPQTPRRRKVKVAVLGGGITGLAAAHRLIRNDRDVRVVLIESDHRLGGMISTIRRDGLVMEAGPDLFLGAKPGGWELAHALGIEDRLVGTRHGLGASYLLGRGRLRRMPEGLTGLVPTRMMPFVTTPLISILGKARVAMDLFIPPRRGDADESVEAFVVRRLGREMYERIVEPLLSGIFAGDGSRLSLLGAFPHMRRAELEHGSMTRSMLSAKAKKSAAAPQRGFMTFPGGMSEMVEALEEALEESGRVAVRKDTRCTAVQRENGGLAVELCSGDTLSVDGVVSALPAHAAAKLFDEIDTQLALLLGAVEYVATATVNLAFRRVDVPHPLDASGWISPRAERRPVLACTWTSSKFEGRSPDDVALFRAFVGDARQDLLRRHDDLELVRIARHELRTVLGIEAEPLTVELTRWDPGLPQPNLGHLESVSAIERRVAEIPGLEIGGSSFHGIGIPDAIRSGERAADNLLAWLRQPAASPAA
jgi:protoporphyrinogen/coproporphyrinogen III oxidase